MQLRDTLPTVPESRPDSFQGSSMLHAMECRREHLDLGLLQERLESKLPRRIVADSSNKQYEVVWRLDRLREPPLPDELLFSPEFLLYPGVHKHRAVSSKSFMTAY